MVGECKVCDKPASQVCGGCKEVSYCGREHQVDDWKRHKSACKRQNAYRVEKNSRLGRYMVATRDLKAGETVIRESPLVLGPKMNTRPICLGCHAPLPHDNCPLCHWPVCSPQCSILPSHTEECRIMSSRGFKCSVDLEQADTKHGIYSMITPLRCLLLKPESLSKFLDLESHLEIRRTSKLYKVLETNLVTFITSVLKLPFNADTIMRVCGVLDTNCFDVKCKSGSRLRGVYLHTSMMSHDCRPNTKHNFHEDESIEVIATVDIPADSPITANYSQSLWGTEARREQLLASKCFLCSCFRCQDRTELGTYLGALSCPSCRQGLVTSLDPLDPGSKWQCSSCSHYLSAAQICDHHVDLQDQVERLDKSHPSYMEDFIRKHLSETPWVHRNMYEILQVKYGLMQLYGRKPKELSEGQKQRREEVLRDLLKVADVLEPGLSRIRGQLISQLAATLLAKVMDNNNSCVLSQDKEQINEISKLLDEAKEISKTEPELQVFVKEQITLMEKCFSSLTNKPNENVPLYVTDSL